MAVEMEQQVKSVGSQVQMGRALLQMQRKIHSLLLSLAVTQNSSELMLAD
jgi:hypothetical protein